ncbi:LysR substrate-binding domain-containing protein [Allorhizobium taibaishanense]|uniref:LysR family glycine cleavage system transcriptional activator n=1 Tax=Allorhizobium taibaishanense TaxID=887144 RepID=A0A1Q9A2Z1_9HYPH|nr:LysR substrate-binding domain-containing protein [Allorhizobium taibaishanense]MBB4005922.1 LysR family glycine cleavage system transcriptional activator [Allorhizobium taibaishanense]OLP48954.1 transcriptional regulator [Allorhizobium taibaishanense]
MKLPPLTALRAFEAAARLESFARAADELGTTAAAVSQHVRALEDWLGQPLFERRPRGVTLNGDGRTFGAEVSSGLGLIATAAARLKAASKHETVTLACLPSVVTHWLGPRLPGFRQLYPEVQVTISYAAAQAVRAQDIQADLLLCHGVKPHPGARKILSGETQAAASPAFLALKGPFQHPADLLQADLLHDETVDGWRRWFETAGLRGTVKPGPIFADFTLLRSSLLAGLGVGLCPIALIEEDLAEGRLQLLFDHGSDLDRAYWLVERQLLSPAATLMRDWLIREAEGL